MADEWLDLGGVGGGLHGGGSAGSDDPMVPAAPPAKRLKKSRATRPSEGGDGDKANDMEDVTRTHRGRKPSHTFMQKMEATLFGRVCTLCNNTDRCPDPITPKHTRLWGSYKKQQNGDGLQTEGCTCWYCIRVWQVRYMSDMGLGALKTSKGKSHSLHEEFDKYLHWLIGTLLKQYEEHGDREALHVVSWPSPQQLLTMDIHQVVFTKPKQKFLDLATYTAKHGDPAQRGDVIVEGPGGAKLVRIASEEVWKREEKIIYQAVKQRVYDDGTDELTQARVCDRTKHAAIQSTTNTHLSRT